MKTPSFSNYRLYRKIVLSNLASFQQQKKVEIDQVGTNSKKMKTTIKEINAAISGLKKINSDDKSTVTAVYTLEIPAEKTCGASLNVRKSNGLCVLRIDFVLKFWDLWWRRCSKIPRWYPIGRILSRVLSYPWVWKWRWICIWLQ